MSKHLITLTKKSPFEQICTRANLLLNSKQLKSAMTACLNEPMCPMKTFWVTQKVSKRSWMFHPNRGTPAFTSQNWNNLKNNNNTNRVWSTWNQKNHRLKQCVGKCNKQRVYDFFGCPWGNTHPSSPISHSDAIHVNTVVRVSARSSLLLKLQVTYCQLCLCYWTVVQKKTITGMCQLLQTYYYLSGNEMLTDIINTPQPLAAGYKNLHHAHSI